MPDTNPSVFISPNVLVDETSKKKIDSRIFIGIGILVVLVIVGVILFRGSNNQTGSSGGNQVRTNVDTKPRIVLVSDKKEYKVGDGVIVAVGVSTGGKKTDGTDVIIHYDNKLLTASSSGLLNGNIYPEYPIASIDQKSGTIKVSGTASVNQTFAGEGLLTTVLMTTVKPGQAKITVDYTPGSTIDSNIVESTSSKDVLEEVNNLTLSIK